MVKLFQSLIIMLLSACVTCAYSQTVTIKIISPKDAVLPYSLKLEKQKFKADKSGLVTLTKQQFEQFKEGNASIIFRDTTSSLFYEDNAICLTKHASFVTDRANTINLGSKKLREIIDLKRPVFYFKSKQVAVIPAGPIVG